MLGKTYKDETGKVHSFEEILEIFDSLTKKLPSSIQLTYSPTAGRIIIIYHGRLNDNSLTSYTFTEI